MKKVEFLRRDGTARTGRFEWKEGEYSPLPGVYETEVIFPTLSGQKYSNIPPVESEEFVRRWIRIGREEPIPVHIHAEEEILSGDLVMMANWHSLLTQPRDFTISLEILKNRLPPDTIWYLPAAALPENAAVLVHCGIDLFDFVGVDLKSASHQFCLPDGTYPESVMDEGVCSCPGCQKGDLKEHNRRALLQEFALLRARIRDGTFRELLDGRCRTRPEYVSIMRHIDRSPYTYLRTPVARSTPMLATSGDSLHRPEIRRFAERLLTRYIPPRADVAVLLPCSARKPYTLSQSHRKFMNAIGRRAHELIITSPLGLVPRDIELAYPASHYDVPVTGYWDHEERYLITDILTKYFEKNQYKRVIAHLDGDALLIAKEAADRAGFELECTCTGNPTSPGALRELSQALAGEWKIKQHLVRGMCSFQFGYDLKTPGMVVKGTYPELVVQVNRRQYFSIDYTHGLLRPTFEGWSQIESGYRVYIDDFVPKGDILAPGVVEADPAILDGDEVLVIGDHAQATGKAIMSADEMVRSHRGIAVRVRKVKKLEG